jgi:RNA recognition motif-containing protein
MNQPVNDSVDNYALFVGSLSANTMQEHLVKYFSRFGMIQGANLITDWATGTSKRCAIVFCADEKTCRNVLDQKTHRLDGKMIRVSLADQEKKGTKKISTTNLFVGNIAEKCSEQEIRLLFDKFGQIESVRFFKNASTKPNTKNAIIQYVDSKSVELAFKSKSEMGSTDESLKISPLKQKKAPSLREDPIEEMTNMMIQMQMYSQTFEPAPPLPSLGIHMKGLQFGNPATNGSLSEIDDDFPQVVRRHRKSSSVDVLPAKPSNSQFLKPEMFSGMSQSPLNSFNMQKQNHITNVNTAKFTAPPIKLFPSVPTRTAEALHQELERASDAHERTSVKNNFVTLIDLFDDDDNLSASFYGVSPMRRSKNLGSTNKSRHAIGDSSSECPEEDHSAQMSD